VFEKYPNVPAIAGSRTFQINGDVTAAAGVEISQSVLLPGIFVKIDGQKIASFVEKEGIDAHGKVSVGFLAVEVTAQVSIQ
jgi:hypothetical protein